MAYRGGYSVDSTPYDKNLNKSLADDNTPRSEIHLLVHTYEARINIYAVCRRMRPQNYFMRSNHRLPPNRADDYNPHGNIGGTALQHVINHEFSIFCAPDFTYRVAYICATDKIRLPFQFTTKIHTNLKNEKKLLILNHRSKSNPSKD